MMKLAAFFGKRHQENAEPKLAGKEKSKTAATATTTTTAAPSRGALSNITNKGVATTTAEAGKKGNEKAEKKKEATVAAATAGVSKVVVPVSPAPMDTSVRKVALPEGVEDIDTPDMENPAFCSEYVLDVIANLRKKEVAERVPPNYMEERQHTITPRVRNILADWMVEVINRFDLCIETTFLAINVLDKYLSRVEVQQRDLQLIGVSAIFIASKCEDIYAVALDDLIAITGNAVSERAVVAQERKILTAIDWCLTSPYPIHFLRRYSKAADSDGFVHTVSKFLLELAALHYDMLAYLPSMQAAAAVYLARCMCGEDELWSKTTEYYSGYNLEEIKPCVNALNALVLNPNKRLRSVHTKYASKKYGEVSKLHGISDPTDTKKEGGEKALNE